MMLKKNQPRSARSNSPPKHKRRLERPTKAYELHDCALYSVRGYGQLLRALQWPGTAIELRQLATDQASYNVFDQEQDGKVREVQSPVPQLAVVQARVATLLRRVAPPQYRHSGVRGRSFLSNAEKHLNAHPAVRIDIRRYYPSTTFAHVNVFFRDTMKCAADVANLLAQVCCYGQQHLPTGGKHSEELAFQCHRVVFDRLHERAINRAGTMTVYVDDIFVSMPQASDSDLKWARNVFAKHGLVVHPEKSRVFRSNAQKIVTGVVVKDGKPRVLNRMHHRAGVMRRQLSDSIDGSNEQIDFARSLLGRLSHLAQIDERQRGRYIGACAALKPLIARANKARRYRKQRRTGSATP